MGKKNLKFGQGYKVVLLLSMAAIALVCVIMFMDSDSGMMLLSVAAAGVPAQGGGVVVKDEPLTTGATRELSPELLEKDIYEKVIKVRPGNTPIDTITRKAKRRKCKSQITEFYSMGVMPTNSTLKTAVAQNTSQNALTTIDITDANFFDVNDTILVPSVEISEANGGYLMLYVQKKTDDGKFVVLAANTTQNRMPAIPQGAELVRMGFAGAEKDAQCPAMQGLPTKSRNYCQVFEKQVEESEFQKLTSKEVEWNMTDVEEQAVYDYKRAVEFSLLFGSMSEIFDSLKKETVYTTQGMWWQAENEFEYQKNGSFDNTTLSALSKEVFSGNNGSDRRFLFAGADLIEKLQNLEVTRTINDENEYVKLGMTFSSIVTKFGRLEVIHAEVFDQMGLPGNGFVLDPANIQRNEFKPFTRTILDLKKSGQRNVNAVFMQEVCCVNLYNPSTHCRIVAK